MPKAKETSNHPCHFLSLPSAKRFWCRHCMSVFEDAITRWRHSRSCRYGVVNNFMRRRQLEAKALQNTTKPNPIEARLEQSISPSEEPIVVQEDPGPSSSVSSVSAVKTNQATCNDLFRCFICHNKFSTLEEMRHHVKYPCNNKKIVTDVPNPAVTVYIDEFTDRSRQWDPQPQTEEVITSELVPNIVSHETVQSTMDVKSVATQESGGSPSTVNISASTPSGSNLTPTNIYVNEQGETVIEVENLDLNSEGGELSLAHLLTQLSQQGIVFDKTKASQMQAHHEVTTVSDPESGEIYATGTSYDPSARTSVIVKEEDDGQSTAEDAANTLAQLAVFRGSYGRVNQEVPQVSVSTDLQQYVVEGGVTESYTYPEGYAVPHITNTTNVNHLDMTSDSQPQIKVEYQYDYLPTGQSASVSTNPQMSEQSEGFLEQMATTAHISDVEQRGMDNDSGEPRTIPTTVHIQPNQLQQQVVTYLTPQSASSSAIQHVQATHREGETMMIENFVVEHPGTSHQQLSQEDQSSSTISVSADGCLHSHESHHQQSHPPHPHSNIPNSLLEAGQSSYIVINTEDNSTQIICDPSLQDNESQIEIATVRSMSAPGASLINSEVIETQFQEQQQMQREQFQQHQHKLQEDLQHQDQGFQSTVEISENVGELKGEEFEVRTVSLQEIADTEATEPVQYCKDHKTISSELTSVEASTGVVIGASSDDSNHKDSDSTVSALHSVQTVGNAPLDIHPQIANKDIITSSSQAGFTSVTILDHQHQQPLCQVEETGDSLETEETQSVPVYVMSAQGELQLVTSSNDLTQHQQQEQTYEAQ